MSAWLTNEEVAELTAADKPCRRRSTQCQRLAEMGIPFLTNFGGRPLVERQAVLKFKEKNGSRSSLPNWEGMGSAA